MNQRDAEEAVSGCSKQEMPPQNRASAKGEGAHDTHGNHDISVASFGKVCMKLLAKSDGYA